MPSKDDAGNRLHALGCVLLLLFCALLTRPYVEMGICDDWSYIRSAQVLSQSGHIVYNGGTTAMLGWQLYLGAALIKLLGFSFTKVRLSILLLSLITTYLLHRNFTGFGLQTWNATLATLTIMLSPVWLILTVTFMSDAAGLLSIVLCMYGCQRALLARSDASSLTWLYFAAITNMLGGTARQIAWLGVLVLLPSTVWLLRKRKQFLIHGFFLWIAGILWIRLCMHWFLSQPYALPEKLIATNLDRQGIHNAVEVMTRVFLSILLFSVPVLIGFPLLVWKRNRRLALTCIGLVVVALSCFSYVASRRGHALFDVLAPWLGTDLSRYGIMQWYQIIGNDPVLLRERTQLILTACVLVCGLCCAVYIALSSKSKRLVQAANCPSLSWKQTKFLLLPFTMAYLGLLVPRATLQTIYDRYLIPIVVVVAVFALHYIQERIERPLLWPFALTLLFFTAYSVAGTHDSFATYRARLLAANEVTNSGVPRNNLEGGFEYDGWTQIILAGYVNDPRVQVPAGAYHPTSRKADDPCHSFFFRFVPAVEPKYALSFDPFSCYVPSPFAPVAYVTWLPPHQRKIYIQQVR